MAIDHRAEIQRALLAWHREHGMHAPWRESGDPYLTLVAAVMAQQTQISRVMPSYERFVAAFPTVEMLAAASTGDVIRVWAGMGYNSRAVRLRRAACTVVEHGWPRDAASLARIDGIGPFTAAIIASFAFGEPAACVDTNVRRVLGRISGDEGIDGKPLQLLADEMLAADEPARWNQAVMDYGARVCTIRPRCADCVVSRWCASRDRYLAPAPLLRIAEEHSAYDAAASPAGRPSKPKRETPFAGSARYYRGRIIDALRSLPPGEALPLAALPALLANGVAAPPAEEIDALVEALERAGLLVARDRAISLPD